MSDQKKDPLDITDLPEKAEDSDAVKGGYAPRPPIMATKDCNSNTLTCKNTSTTNTLCCE